MSNRYDLVYKDNDEVTEIATIYQKVAPWAHDMTNAEIGLAVRKAMSMGVDPLNHHECQISKDRGAIIVEFSYTLIVEWVKHFKGEHTQPRYDRLVESRLAEEELPADALAYYCKFFMVDDLPKVAEYYEIFGDEAKAMFENIGLGVSLTDEYNAVSRRGNEYFAPNGRSKAWKVKKRALIDAYRRKFGTPTRDEIMILRRGRGEDKISPEDWEGTHELSPDSAIALAKANSTRDEHVLTAEESREAASALFGDDAVDAEFVEADVVERAVEELGAQPQPPAPSDKPAAEIMADNDRPYGVADVLAVLEQRADAFTVTLEDSEPDDNDRRVGLFVSMLGRCFDGGSDKRHVATWGMFGVKDGSAKSVTRAQVRAWLNEYVTRDEDGGYVLQPYAKAEMNAVYTTALEATGQGVMEL